MASPLKRLAKQSLAGAKKQVRLHPLSPEEATAVVFTVLNASPAPLLRAVRNSKAGKGLPANAATDRVFHDAIISTLNVRKGSVYAAIVTAIDQNEVFHTDRFAVSLKRLGVMDDISTKLMANGMASVAGLVANKAPFWWAEMSARELSTVQKELSGTFQRILKKFHEDLDREDIDMLLEAVPNAMMPPKLQFIRGAAQADFGSTQAQFERTVRSILTAPRILRLAESSTFDATFESFYQHLMTNTTALQKLLPKASFAGKALSPQQIQRMFRDPQVAKRFHASFREAYDSYAHGILIDKLYMAIKRNRVSAELVRAARAQANVKLTDDAVSAINSSVIGLFSAFAGDSKGQSFPMMATIKKG